MAGLKVVSFVDSEIVKARQDAIADLESMQRRLLDFIAALGSSMAKLTDRVSELEQQRTRDDDAIGDIGQAIAGVGERVKQLEQQGTGIGPS
jgi:hypothetical protein